MTGRIAVPVLVVALALTACAFEPHRATHRVPVDATSLGLAG